MVALRDLNGFLVVRYLVFGLFAICNAITCSVAVWNYSLVLYHEPAQLDIYLIFLGAFSLLSIFTLIFVELLCINALTTHMWFECAWVAVFWLMELGAAALIAIESQIGCSVPTTIMFLDTLCTSERVLLAFTWICTITLLIYLLTLMFIAASRYDDDPRIWFCDVRAAAVRQHSSSKPDSPLTTRLKRYPSVYTVHSSRSQPVQTLAGLSPYKIEPFQPVFAVPEQMDTLPPLDLPEATPLPFSPAISSFMKPVPPLPTEMRDMRSLSLTQFNTPQELVQSIEYSSSGRLGPMSAQSTSLPGLSPLGNWPRQDVMQLPVRPKRKPPPPSASEFPRNIARTDRSPLTADAALTPRPRRPSGPRERALSVESGNRPAQLDLYGVRIHETGRRDDDRSNNM